MSSLASATADPTAEPTTAYPSDPAEDSATNNIHIPIVLLIWTHLLILFLVTLCVGTRLYVRRVIIKRISFDDMALVAALAAFVLNIAFDMAIGINIQVHGLQAEFWSSYKLLLFWEIPFLLTTVSVRGAIAAFFLRALPKVIYFPQRLAIVLVFWTYALYMTIYTFVAVYQCGSPTEYSFADDHACFPATPMAILPVVARVTTMVLDWAMTLIPVVILVRSPMPMRRKIPAISLMVLAGTGSIISILRIVYNDLGAINGPSDFPHVFLYFILALLENGTALVVVSLAACRPLFEKVIGNVKSTSYGVSVPHAEPMINGDSSDIKKQDNLVFITQRT